MSTAVAWRRARGLPAPLHLVGTVAGATVDEVLADWRHWQEASNLSERTIRERANTITQLVAFSGCDPVGLTPAHIMNYLTRPGITNTSRATYHATIRAFCKYLVLTGRRDVDPSMGTPKPRRAKTVPRPVEPQQLLDTLQLVLARRAHHKRTHMMLLLAAFAGLRIHEIAKIRGEDFDRAAGLLYVQGKGGKRATVPVHELILAEAGTFPRKGYWFPSYSKPGEPVCPHAVAKTISSAMAAAGVKATAHQLRHFYGTSLVRNGIDLRTVQVLMRHENLSTTAIYTQVSDKQSRAGIDSLTLQ